MSHVDVFLHHLSADIGSQPSIKRWVLYVALKSYYIYQSGWYTADGRYYLDARDINQLMLMWETYGHQGPKRIVDRMVEVCKAIDRDGVNGDPEKMVSGVKAEWVVGPCVLVK